MFIWKLWALYKETLSNVLLVGMNWKYISTMYEARWGTFAFLNDSVLALLVQRFPLWPQIRVLITSIMEVVLVDRGVILKNLSLSFIPSLN